MIGGIVGRKLGMTQVYDEARRLHPLTVIEAGPCGVTAIRTQDRHGYDAVQIGFQEVVERKLTKAQRGHLCLATPIRLWKHLKEFRGRFECQVGDTIKVDLFEKGEQVLKGEIICKQSVDARQAKLDEANALMKQKELEWQASKTLVEKGYRSK